MTCEFDDIFMTSCLHKFVRIQQQMKPHKRTTATKRCYDRWLNEISSLRFLLFNKKLITTLQIRTSLPFYAKLCKIKFLSTHFIAVFYHNLN